MTAVNNNRDVFLNRVASKLGRERIHNVQRPDLSGMIPDSYGALTTDDLISILKEQCFFIHTQLIESTPDILQRTLDDLIAANGGGQVMTSGDRRFAGYGVSFPDSTVWSGEASREENISRSEAANTVIVFADYVLAESGTIVVESRPDQGRALHFLPEHYIAIVEKERIVLRSTQAAAALNRRVEAGESVGSSINLISGPSNSADIEMQLVVGVHGPLRATYVLI